MPRDRVIEAEYIRCRFANASDSLQDAGVALRRAAGQLADVHERDLKDDLEELRNSIAEVQSEISRRCTARVEAA